MENPSGVRHDSLRRGCFIDLPLQLGRRMTVRALAGSAGLWLWEEQESHASWDPPIFFKWIPFSPWNLLIRSPCPPPTTLFVSLFCSEAPWSPGDTQWNGSRVGTDVHRANSEPGSQCPPREQRGEYHCWGTKWNQLTELWHSSRGTVKHHGIWVYKIEGENIQQKV